MAKLEFPQDRPDDDQEGAATLSRIEADQPPPTGDGGFPDISNLRLPQNFEEQVGVKKALLTVPVRKPNNKTFVRVRPEPEWRLDTNIIELKEERESYLVARNLWPDLAAELVPVTLVAAVDRQRVFFLWPLRLQGERVNPWHESAWGAAQLAMRSWIRVQANMALGAYEVFEATGDLGEPGWPELSLQQILSIAFKGRYIESWDHPILKRLRGEA